MEHLIEKKPLERVVMHCYKPQSLSGRVLREALGIRLVGPVGGEDGSKLTIINWGCGYSKDLFFGHDVVNVPENVSIAVNKLDTLDALYGKVPVPEYTTDWRLAARWIEDGPVFCRRRLEGADGAGLVLARTKEELDTRCPLYTKFVGKIFGEYRIMVAGGKVVSRQKKVRRRDHVGPYNDYIKTTDGGYGLEFIELAPAGVVPAAIAAIDALGLWMGGVDVLATGDFNNPAVVLEVNTAPQLTPLACSKLAARIREVFVAA